MQMANISVISNQAATDENHLAECTTGVAMQYANYCNYAI